MKQIILLGAGASVDAGIKDAFGMTKQFVELFAKEPQLAKQSHALRYVVSGLMLQRGAKGENPFDGANIEDVFNATQLLATRQLFEAAPFVMGWHPVVEELDVVGLIPRIKHDVSVTTQGVNSSIARNIDDWLKDLVQRNRTDHRIGNEVRRMVEQSLRNLVSTASEGGERPGEGRVFSSTCDTMIRKLIDLVWLRDEDRQRVDYLKPLVRHASANGVTVTTLNYDNAIELAAVSENLGVNTEMGEVMPSAYDVHLLKLHGSINWCAKPQQGIGVLPSREIVPADEKQMKDAHFRPAVIFGQRNKLTAEGPFLKLLASFRNALAEAVHLIVIGYSFRDAHMNELIANWFNGFQERRITIVTPDQRWSRQSEFARNVSAIRDRVQVIEKTAAQAIPDLFAPPPSQNAASA